MSRANLGTMYANDTLPVAFVVKTRTGIAQDLTGCAITWTLTDEDGDLIHTATVGDGLTVTNAASGQCELLIEDGILGDAGRYDYRLVIELPTGETYTFAKGSLQILP